MQRRQKGFVVLLVVVVVAIIATLWLATKHQGLISVFKNEEIDQNHLALKDVKRRLLEFAVLQPEIYMTSTVGVLQSNSTIPAVGYLPCPDLDGDGLLTGSESSCGNPLISGNSATGFVPDPLSAVGLGSCTGGGSICTGYVPQEIDTRDVYFAPKKRYFYVLDERFSTQNLNYNDPSGTGPKRYAPLTPGQFVGDPASASNSLEPFEPILRLNGVGGFVALVIDAGENGLDPANKDGNSAFVSGKGNVYLTNASGEVVGVKNDESVSGVLYDDQVVGISFNDWITLIAHRVCAEHDRFSGDAADFDALTVTEHWVLNYDASNLVGSNWLSWGVACP